MARARRKQPSQVVDNGAPPTVKTLPAVCPLCGGSFPREMLTHLHRHAPVELCQHCDGKDKGWRLDTDGATHFRPDVSLFYCSHCGRYPPMNVGEEVSPSGEA